MKKFISLLIGCSLALAGAAMAQQPEEKPSPKAGKPAAEKTHEAKGKRGGNAANPEATAAKQPGGMKEHGAMNEPGAGKGRKGKTTEPSTDAGVSAQTTGSATTEPGAMKHGRMGKEKSATSAGAGTDVSAQPTPSEIPGAKHQGEHGRKGMKGDANAGANVKTMPSATPVTSASVSATSTTATSASVAPVAATGELKTQTGAGGAVTKVDRQKVQEVKKNVQQIKEQHVNFRAQARPDKVPAVSFSAGYRIQGSDRWQGPQYEVYRSYHPERHDRGWYSTRYNRVELIGGGYYYWNNGYWYPAWGYDSSNEYYAYDAPIYVGKAALPPDRVIADVQAALQEMGYYRGEVDGLLGPLTREAVAGYQADQGLMTTAVIDEPTLDSLGMG